MSTSLKQGRSQSPAEGIVVTDANGLIIDANDVACAILGYPINELKQLRAAELIVDQNQEPFECAGAYDVGASTSVTQRIRRKDGSEIEVSSSSTRLASGQYIGVFRDLTAEREAEESLRSTLAWFSLIVEQVPAILWTTDKELRFTSGTGAALRNLAISPEESIGTTLHHQLGSDDENAEPVQAHRAALAGETSSYELDWNGRSLTVCVKPFRNTQDEIIGVLGLAQDITSRKQAELALQQAKSELEQQVSLRTEELQQANEQLRSEILLHKQTAERLKKEQKFLRDLLELHERDRQILSYEIHDGLVQYITGGLMRLEGYQVGQQAGTAGCWGDFEFALGLMRKAVSEARRLISGLRPPILDESGLAVALEYLANEHRQATGMEVETSLEMTSSRLAKQIENALFRIAQEALTNIRRHSDSKDAKLKLREEDGWIRLTVEDSGVGFDPNQVSETSFGLHGIRERTRLLDGRFHLESVPGDGTKLEVEFPVTPAMP